MAPISTASLHVLISRLSLLIFSIQWQILTYFLWFSPVLKAITITQALDMEVGTQSSIFFVIDCKPVEKEPSLSGVCSRRTIVSCSCTIGSIIDQNSVEPASPFWAKRMVVHLIAVYPCDPIILITSFKSSILIFCPHKISGLWGSNQLYKCAIDVHSPRKSASRSSEGVAFYASLICYSFFTNLEDFIPFMLVIVSFRLFNLRVFLSYWYRIRNGFFNLVKSSRWWVLRKGKEGKRIRNLTTLGILNASELAMLSAV